MTQIVNRSESAFSALMERYGQIVHAFALQFCGSRQDAEDIAQETFLRVWQKATTFRPNVVLVKTWLLQITRNLCIDRTRKSSPVGDFEIEIEDVGDSGSPDTKLLNEQQAQLLRAHLSNLPERQRTAILLCNVEGWSQAHVAQVLACSESALEGLIQRGRRALRLQLEHQL